MPHAGPTHKPPQKHTTLTTPIHTAREYTRTTHTPNATCATRRNHTQYTETRTPHYTQGPHTSFPGYMREPFSSAASIVGGQTPDLHLVAHAGEAYAAAAHHPIVDNCFHCVFFVCGWDGWN